VPIRQPNGSAHVRVLSEPSRFGARSNFTKSNQLRAVPVPNLYRFGTVSTNPRPNRWLAVSRFLPARILKFAAGR
jgi:hypothetical protein